jgi:hypothetical protein
MQLYGQPCGAIASMRTTFLHHLNPVQVILSCGLPLALLHTLPLLFPVASGQVGQVAGVHPEAPTAIPRGGGSGL